MGKAQHAQTLQCAIDGYNGLPHDHQSHGLFTSTHHAAFCVGQWLRDTGRTMPHEVRPGRGDTMHCNGMLLRLHWGNVKHPTITREH